MSKTAEIIKVGEKYHLTYAGIVLMKSGSKETIRVRFNHGKVAKVNKAGITDFVDKTGETDVSMASGKKASRFDIHKRMDFMSQLTQMVVDGDMKSLVITGEPGTGKTYGVIKKLHENDLKENRDFVIIKGHSTPKAMFRSLYENQDRIVVYDDCDDVLKDLIARGILKAALDSFDKRIVHWRTEKSDDTLPSSFEFKGQIIFISNIPGDKMDSAIVSRSILVDVSMTKKEKIERMRKILPDLEDDCALSSKEEALDLLAELQDDAVDFNIRSLLRVIRIRKAYHVKAKKSEWAELAEYMVTQ